MKQKNVNLEKYRTIFLEIGLIIALGIVLFLFEVKTYEKTKSEVFAERVDDTPEEMIEITQHEKPPPPPKPQIQQSTIIEIVEDEVEVDDDLEIDVEANQDTEMDIYVAPPEIEEEEEEEEEKMVFTVVESMPSFPGGDAARVKYLNENISYPQMARESNIQGRVFITFVVETDGSITDVRILRGIGGGCDQEAIRVIENMPNWIPGRQRGKAVRVQFNMPILFKLN